MSRRRTLHQPARRALTVSVVSAVSTAFLLLPAAPAQAATRDIDLWAVKGTTTLPNGVSVPVWGYSLTGSAVDRKSVV